MFRGFTGATEDAALIRDANNVFNTVVARPDFQAKIGESSPTYDANTWVPYIQFANALGAVNGNRPDYYVSPGVLTDAGRSELQSRLDDFRRFLTVTAPVATDQSALIALVTANYRQYLNREPDAGGLTFWVNELATGRKTQADLVNAFLVSGEYLAAHPIAGATPAPGVAGAGDADPIEQPASSSGMSPVLLIGLAAAAYFLLKD